MSRRAPWLIGAGVGAVALGGAIYLIWKYTEDEDDEKLGRTFTRFTLFFHSRSNVLYWTMNRAFSFSHANQNFVEQFCYLCLSCSKRSQQSIIGNTLC
jgi:hypothetical protein